MIPYLAGYTYMVKLFLNEATLNGQKRKPLTLAKINNENKNQYSGEWLPLWVEWGWDWGVRGSFTYIGNVLVLMLMASS